MVEEKECLISHSNTSESMSAVIGKTGNKIRKAGDLPGSTVEQRLTLLDELSQFDLGCFLLKNHGLNAYWTHYVVNHPFETEKPDRNNRNEPFSPLERFLLEEAPCMKATQERFTIFQKACQKKVVEGAVLASIPSGMMSDLLLLDFSRVKKFHLVGIDFDQEALDLAQTFAAEHHLSGHIELMRKNAWELGIHEQFDLVSSNGLNIYEPDSERVTALYRQFYQAIKPGGTLVTSFLTFPPNGQGNCEWDMEGLNTGHLQLQQTIFKDVIGAGWQCFCTSEQAEQQLKDAGFSRVNFIYDRHLIFPTAIAVK